MANEDNLASAIAASLNGKSSNADGRKVAYFLGDKESPSEIDHWVSTGSTVLDMIISNREDGGLPVGKIVEFNGLQGSGKSLVANHLLANTQKMGGISVLVDTENAADFDFLTTIGIDPDGDFLYVAENRLEKIFDIVETVISKVKAKSNSNKFVTIVIDSIAGSVTENEVEGDYELEGFNTNKAQVLGRAMRKITGLVGREKVLLVFTNQVRTNPGVMYGDPFTTPGGHAIPFHSSVRVRMRSTKKIREKKDGIKQVVGVKIRPHVIKNRLGPPERHTEFDLYFNSGIDDFSSWWDVLKDHKILQHSSSGWYKVYDEDEDGEKVPYVSEGKDKQMKIQEANFTKECQENPQFRKDMKRLLAKKLVVQYEDGWVDRSDVEYVDLDESDE